MIRWGSYRIHQSLVKKPLRLTDFWPLKWDKKKDEERIVMTAEMLKRVKEKYKLK